MHHVQRAPFASVGKLEEEMTDDYQTIIDKLKEIQKKGRAQK